MGTTIAPRIDERLRRLIATAPDEATAAEVTRLAGTLAGTLALPRPSYQQVRVLLKTARSTETDPVRPRWFLSAAQINEVLGFLYEYPGPGLADWYERYKHGLL
ncbi:MAG TPA: hypothetical protein VNH45_03730 [Gaiellaceae bacterium]|nr:hypothetical protein [Gaiellaceae bacterium]